jgi:hypothetical protein
VAFLGREEVHVEEGDDLGVLLTREEVLELMRLMLASSDSGSLDLRLRAALGRVLLPGGPIGRARGDLADVLPPWVFRVASPGRDRALEGLGRLNDEWEPAAAWESLEFGFVPLSLVP